MTLEQQLAALIHNNGLLNISITASVSGGCGDEVGSEVKFYAGAQAPGGDINGRWVGSTSLGPSVAASVQFAISDLNEKRGDKAVAALAPIEGLAT